MGYWKCLFSVNFIDICQFFKFRSCEINVRCFSYERQLSWIKAPLWKHSNKSLMSSSWKWRLLFLRRLFISTWTLDSFPTTSKIITPQRAKTSKIQKKVVCQKIFFSALWRLLVFRKKSRLKIVMYFNLLFWGSSMQCIQLALDQKNTRSEYRNIWEVSFLYRRA